MTAGLPWRDDGDRGSRHAHHPLRGAVCLMLERVAGTVVALAAGRVGMLRQQPRQCLVAEAPPKLAGLFDGVVTRPLRCRGRAQGRTIGQSRLSLCDRRSEHDGTLPETPDQGASMAAIWPGPR